MKAAKKRLGEEKKVGGSRGKEKAKDKLTGGRGIEQDAVKHMLALLRQQEEDMQDDKEEGGEGTGNLDEKKEGPQPSTSRHAPLTKVKTKPKPSSSFSQTTNVIGPVITSFVDPSKAPATFDAMQKEMKKAFMSSKITKVIGTDVIDESSKGKKRKNEEMSTEEAALESHLSQLDGQLSKLLSLPSTTTSSSNLLTQILSIPTPDGPPPRKVQKQVHGRKIIRSMAAHSHKRALKHDSMLDPSAHKKDRQAKTLRERRKERGEDKQERGLRGAVGKIGKGGLKVSKEEIRRINGKS